MLIFHQRLCQTSIIIKLVSGIYGEASVDLTYNYQRGQLLPIHSSRMNLPGTLISPHLCTNQQAARSRDGPLRPHRLDTVTLMYSGILDICEVIHQEYIYTDQMYTTWVRHVPINPLLLQETKRLSMPTPLLINTV